MDSPGQLAFMDSLRSSTPSKPSRSLAFAAGSGTSERRRAVSTGPTRRRPTSAASTRQSLGKSASGTMPLAAAIERASQVLPATQRTQLKFLAEKISQVVNKLQMEERRRKAAEAETKELRTELSKWRVHASQSRAKYAAAAQDGGVNAEAYEDALQREAALKAEKAAWEQKTAQHESAVAQLTRMNDMLMERLDGTKRESAAVQEGHAAAVRALDEQLATARRQIAVLEDELADGTEERNRTLADVHARTDELRSDTGRLRRRAEAAEVKASAADAARRKAEEGERVQQSELRRTIRKMAANEKRVATLTKELDAAADDNESLRQRLDAVRSRCEQLTAEVSRLNRVVEERDAKLADALNAAKSTRLTLEGSEAAASKRVAKAATEVAAMKDKLEAANHRVEELAAEVATLSHLDQTQQAQVERAESLTAKLAAEVEESGRLRDEVERLTSALVDARQAGAETSAKLHVSQQELAAALARLEVQTREATDISQIQNKQALKHERDVMRLQNELDNVRDEKDELESSFRMLRLSQDDTLRELATACADRDTLRSLTKELEDRVVSLQEETTTASLDALRRSASFARNSPARTPRARTTSAAARAAAQALPPPSAEAAPSPAAAPQAPATADVPPPKAAGAPPTAEPLLPDDLDEPPTIRRAGRYSPDAALEAQKQEQEAAVAALRQDAPAGAEQGQGEASTQERPEVGSAEDLAARWANVYALTGGATGEGAKPDRGSSTEDYLGDSFDEEEDEEEDVA